MFVVLLLLKLGPWLTISVEEIDGQPAKFNLIEILKDHRLRHMYDKYDVQVFPLAFDDLEAAFHQQVMCT
jgi:hypothetical protein